MRGTGRRGKVIAANIWGKVKTVAQMTYIYIFLFLAIAGKLVARWLEDYSEMYDSVLRWSSLGGIILVAAYTVLTGIQFAKSNWNSLRLGSEL